MWRYFVGGAAALLLGLAGMFLFSTRASQEAPLPPPPSAAAMTAADRAALPEAPEATPKSREERRFDRYDKDRDAAITRDEYLTSRKKAFAKLDRNGNGMLDFDEWAVKTTTKFATADTDRSGRLTRTEFATTAVKRKPARRAANCPPVVASPADDDA